jgi:predicted nucleic acid-binding protein
VLIVSDFAAAEFASGISRHVRTRAMTADDARSVFSEFDEWAAREAERVGMTSSDIAHAEMFLRRLSSALRTPDALHVALAHRMNASLLTFDKTMAAAARLLGIEVIRA